MLFVLLFSCLALATEPLPALKLAPVAAPSVAPAKLAECREAEKQLALFTAGLRVICVSDGDCIVRDISAAPCAVPAVVSKDAIGLESHELKSRQAKAIEACSEEWKKRNACAKPKVRPVCRESKCMDGGNLPGTVK